MSESYFYVQLLTSIYTKMNVKIYKDKIMIHGWLKSALAQAQNIKKII